MESTRSHLRRIIQVDLEALASELGRWLRADASLFQHADGEEPVHPACSGALRNFRAWLARPDPALILRARAVLGGDRAAALAGTFLREYLMSEGFFDPMPRPEREETDRLLNTFFRSPCRGAAWVE